MKNLIKNIISKIIIIKYNLTKTNKIKYSSFLWKSKLHMHVIIHDNCKIINSQIGNYSYIGNNSYVTNCEIGKYTSIASGFTCAFGRHPISEIVSTHPFFYSKKWNKNLKNDLFEEYRYIDKENKVLAKIGNDVWIGTNVIILDGITIGDGAIIGAGTIVTKNVPPYSICVGVPAKVISYRFEKNVINKLEKIKWWDRNEEWIEKNIDKFLSVEKMVGSLDE